MLGSVMKAAPLGTGLGSGKGLGLGSRLGKGVKVGVLLALGQCSAGFGLKVRVTFEHSAFITEPSMRSEYYPTTPLPLLPLPLLPYPTDPTPAPQWGPWAALSLPLTACLTWAARWGNLTLTLTLTLTKTPRPHQNTSPHCGSAPPGPGPGLLAAVLSSPLALITPQGLRA